MYFGVVSNVSKQQSISSAQPTVLLLGAADFDKKIVRAIIVSSSVRHSNRYKPPPVPCKPFYFQVFSFLCGTLDFVVFLLTFFLTYMYIYRLFVSVLGFPKKGLQLYNCYFAVRKLMVQSTIWYSLHSNQKTTFGFSSFTF